MIFLQGLVFEKKIVPGVSSLKLLASCLNLKKSGVKLGIVGVEHKVGQSDSV